MTPDSFLGRPYTDDYDCVHFAVDFLTNVHGYNIGLIGDHGEGVSTKYKQLVRRFEDYLYPIDTPDNPCVALLGYGGRLRHIGVYYENGAGIPMIIHNTPRASGVIQCAAKDINRHGYDIVGYMQCKAL